MDKINYKPLHQISVENSGKNYVQIIFEDGKTYNTPAKIKNIYKYMKSISDHPKHGKPVKAFWIKDGKLETKPCWKNGKL